MNTECEQLYLKMMANIKIRIDFLSSRALDSLPLQAGVEMFALQIRKCIEAIVFSSLVANKKLYSELYDDFSLNWRIGQLMKRLEKINPEYFPVPILEESEGDPKIKSWKILSGPEYLTTDFLIDIYDLTSKYIHEPNPFGNVRANVTELEKVTKFSKNSRKWLPRFIAHLNCHQVVLTGTQTTFLVHMHEEGRDGPVIYKFEPCPPP